MVYNFELCQCQQVQVDIWADAEWVWSRCTTILCQTMPLCQGNKKDVFLVFEKSLILLSDHVKVDPQGLVCQDNHHWPYLQHPHHLGKALQSAKLRYMMHWSSLLLKQLSTFQSLLALFGRNLLPDDGDNVGKLIDSGHGEPFNEDHPLKPGSDSDIVHTVILSLLENQKNVLFIDLTQQHNVA